MLEGRIHWLAAAAIVLIGWTWVLFLGGCTVPPEPGAYHSQLVQDHDHDGEDADEDDGGFASDGILIHQCNPLGPAQISASNHGYTIYGSTFFDKDDPRVLAPNTDGLGGGMLMPETYYVCTASLPIIGYTSIDFLILPYYLP